MLKLPLLIVKQRPYKQFNKIVSLAELQMLLPIRRDKQINQLPQEVLTQFWLPCRKLQTKKWLEFRSPKPNQLRFCKNPPKPKCQPNPCKHLWTFHYLFLLTKFKTSCSNSKPSPPPSKCLCKQTQKVRLTNLTNIRTSQ